MKFSKSAAVFGAIASCLGGAHASAMSFQSESTRATAALNCPSPKTMPAMPGLGALYTCVVGKGETVKFFINEAENTGQVKDVKLMWNDWFKDVGYGVHADKAEMQSFVKAFSKLYAPQLEQKLISTFGGSTNATIEAGEFKIVYTYKRGPAIDERLFVLTPKRR